MKDGMEGAGWKRRMVVLVHMLPAGDAHFDWLIQASPDASDRVLTFRTRIHPAEGLVFSADKLADHRSIYLTYEGEVSGGRGSVQRVWEGTIERVEMGESNMEVEAGGWLWKGRACGGGAWVWERTGHEKRPQGQSGGGEGVRL
ncbi:MAG TPA: hypothetical protein VK176_04920 [Phycisphaerales bacterium]|nr:hypothetical protein [Phycisphaerales bacterium]